MRCIASLSAEDRHWLVWLGLITALAIVLIVRVLRQRGENS